MGLSKRLTTMLLGLALVAFGSKPAAYPSMDEPQPKMYTDLPTVPYIDWLPKMVKEEAKRAGVDSQILWAVVQHESGGDPHAVNPDDPSYGLGQVMPRWWRYVFVRQCGNKATPETLMDPRLNLCYTAHILAYAQRRYSGDRSSMISYYNTGDPHRGRYNGYNRAVESHLPAAD